MRRLAFFLLLLVVGETYAQVFSSTEEQKHGKVLWDDFIEEYMSDEERADEEDLQLCLQDLKELFEHPLNINTATISDLRQLPFLSDKQIEQIHAYIYFHGQMQTLSELRLVPLLDDATCRRLSLFTYAEAEQLPSQRSSNRLHHNFSTRLDVPLYYRNGQLRPDGYRGDPLYHRIRYTLSGSHHFSAGLRIEKDAGERFYDSYGAYVALQDMGCVRRAVAGDFRIGFGEGLVLGNSTWSSKTAPSLKVQSGLRPMTGMDETNFFRGAAVTLSPGRDIRLSLFASHRKRDATLTDKGEVQTLLSSGYHRTRTEWDRRRNVGSTVAGGNVDWQGRGFHIGATGYWQQFSRTLNPGTQPYRAIYPRGENFGAMGLNYGYTHYRLSLAGETAYSTARSGIATINRASWTFSRRYVLSAVQRFYAYQYYSFYSNALAENGNAQNESGILLHLQAEPLTGLSLTAYADFFYHPWPRFRMTHSSTGQDFMLQGTHTIARRHTLSARYHLKRKESADIMEPHHRLTTRWSYEPSRHWHWQTTAALHRVLGSTGAMLAQRVRCTMPRPGLRFDGQLGYFRTDDYLSRIHVVRPALHSSVSSASFYGHGMHATLTCCWQSKDRRWMLEASYAAVRYFDRNEQGSGLQTIMSPCKNDLSMQFCLMV